MDTPTRLIVGMSGSSGAIYGIRLLEVLAGIDGVQTHLVMTPAAGQTIALETDWRARDVEALANASYRINDIAASISSGSFPIDGMVVVPCSMKTAAGIAWGFDDNLLTRAADVTLKERRRLVVAPRETPLHLGHLRTLTQLVEIGAIVAPLMPGFYRRPKTVDEIVNQTVGRLLDLLAIESPAGLVERWHGPRSAAPGTDEAG